MIEILGIFSGLIIGILFGFALQRGRFCMNSAFRDPPLFKDFTILKAVALALVVELVGFHLLSSFGIISLAPKSFFLLGTIVGGFVFGIGMVIAGGCASGTAYRAGEGMVSSMLALLAFALTAFVAKNGFLKLLTESVRSADLGKLTLSSITGINSWFFIIIASAVALYFMFRKKEGSEANKKGVIETIFKTGWNWKLTGLIIGLTGILAFVFSSVAGRNYPLGITTGFETIVKSIMTGQNFLTWESFEVMGLIAGAFIAALIANEFKIRVPSLKTAFQVLGGGVLLGLGAVIADGCNIGHILSGIPQLAVSSVVAGTFIVLGAWSGAYFMFMRGERP